MTPHGGPRTPAPAMSWAELQDALGVSRSTARRVVTAANVPLAYRAGRTLAVGIWRRDFPRLLRVCSSIAR